jgi:acyl-CoA thioester hydrolase
MIGEPPSLEGAGNGTAREYRVRFDEAGPNGLARTSALLRYAQDVAWLHSDALGFDREWYEARGLAWLVRAAEVAVLAPVPMGRRVEAATAIVGHRHAWARRRVEIRLPDGELAAWVHTDWVMIDVRGAIARIPPEFGVAFPNPVAAFELSRTRLPVTPDDAHLRSIVVRPQELDPNAHVNNAAYLDWFEEAVLAAMPDGDAGGAALPVNRVPRRYRLEYRSAVIAGAALEGAAWSDGTGWCYRVVDDARSEVFLGRLDW